MGFHLGDTICAIATASGGAARSMVRISGPESVAITAKLFEAQGGEQLADIRQATALQGHVQMLLDVMRGKSNPPLTLTDEEVESIVPCDLFLWPTARSYTREPIAELHTIGSPPILEALLAAVCRAGARLAEPGEFTLRAFLAGRIDLTQAEAVLGVIDARGREDLAGALAQLAGGIARPLLQLREDLLQLLAELEAGLDFVEEDIAFISSDEVLSRLRSSIRLLDDVSRQMESRHAEGGSMQVVLTGAPNVGKSSLFNALVERSAANGARQPTSRRALVSPRSGTTRDYLTATIDLAGVRCELVDTAGVEEIQPEDEINFIAQRLAGERGARATVRACCIEATQADAKNDDVGACDLVVVTKADACPGTVPPSTSWPSELPMIVTSSRTGEGLEKLLAALRNVLTREPTAQGAQIVSATADRCRESIRLANASLQRANDLVTAAGGDELVAAELRSALSELGKVVGAVYADDLLDRIFSRFCIGK